MAPNSATSKTKVVKENKKEIESEIPLHIELKVVLKLGTCYYFWSCQIYIGEPYLNTSI